MEKNEERVGLVVALGVNGEGIIKEDGTVVFVPFTLIGEKIRYKVLKVTSKCAYGKVLEVLTPAEIRVRPKCPVFGKCGGCQLQHIRYLNQLKIKEDNVKISFKKVANLDVNVKPTIHSDDDFRYRNKLQLPVVESNNGPLIGFFAENSHRVVPIDDCKINAHWTKNIIQAFKRYFSIAKITGYNESTNTGDVREIVVKEIKGNLIITVVSLTKNLPKINDLISILKEELRYNFSLYQNVNPNATNVVFGDEFILHYGPKEYQGDMFGIKFMIGVKSFMQVNSQVCSKLYAGVRERIDADQNTTVINAYSGAGLLTALLTKNAKKVIGIEIVKEAVDYADKLAKNNNLSDKIVNYLGKCEDILHSIIGDVRKDSKKVSLSFRA